MNKPLIGFGGGKSGGGSEAPNNLISHAYAQAIDLISEGEIGGLVNGLQSVYFDGTPAQNADLTYNFTGITLSSRTGTQAQTYINGFSDVENQVAVGTEFKYSLSVTRTVTNSNVNAVQVTVSVNALTNLDTSSGDLNGTSVQFAIDLQTNGGGYVTAFTDTITGKTTSKYERAYRIPLSGTGPWDIRCRRITPDSTLTTLVNNTYFEGYTEIIESKLSYPNSALVALQIDSTNFSSIPTRGYDVKLLKVKIPSNYNPLTRVYTGTWDGTFTVAWTDNPAWCFYDVCLNTRYGLGNYITPPDKWALYTISQYCDGMVSNGQGGTEPRFTCNAYFTQRKDAWAFLSDMTSIFRGMIYAAGGAITAIQDSPADPVYLFANANIVDGVFSYAGSSTKALHTVAMVTWNDPADLYRQKVEYVEDAAGISRFGVLETAVVAVGCTSRGQANRVGRWLLYTERLAGETVTFKTGAEGAIIRPGQVIKVADQFRAGTRLGGRISAATSTTATLDATVSLGADSWTLSVIGPDGVSQDRAVTSAAGAVVTVSTAFSPVPAAQSIWVMQKATLLAQQFRIVSITESDGLYEIVGVTHDPGKYSYVESGFTLEARSITSLTPVPDVPGTLTVTQTMYTYQSEVRTKLSISWPWANNATEYRVQWRKDNGNFTQIVTSLAAVDISNLTPGSYDIRVWARGATGVPSVTYSGTSLTVTPKTTPPSDVTGLTITVDATLVGVLNWTNVTDPDLAQYEIRQGSTWASATLLAKVKGTAYKIGIVSAATTYLVKAIDTTGNYSTNAATTTTSATFTTAPGGMSASGITITGAAGTQTPGISIGWSAAMAAYLQATALEYKKTSDSTWSPYAHVAPGLTAAQIKGLEPSTSYDVRLAELYTNGVKSPYAAVTTITTPSAQTVGAAAAAPWTGVLSKPANVAALTGSEGIQNTLVSISQTGALSGAGGGQVTVQPVVDGGTGTGTGQRQTDDPPSYYPVGLTLQFKDIASFSNLVSVSGLSGGYMTLETNKKWADPSGGMIVQYAHCDNGKTFKRYGVTNSSNWTGYSWFADLDTNLYTGALNATNGATWGSNLSSIPGELTDGRVSAGLTASTGVVATGKAITDSIVSNGVNLVNSYSDTTGYSAGATTPKVVLSFTLAKDVASSGVLFNLELQLRVLTVDTYTQGLFYLDLQQNISGTWTSMPAQAIMFGTSTGFSTVYLLNRYITGIAAGSTSWRVVVTGLGGGWSASISSTVVIKTEIKR